MSNSESPTPRTESPASGRELLAFGRRLGLFCVPLAIGWAVLEWGMARVPNSYEAKSVSLERSAGEIDTLILGSSSAYLGIDPSLLEGRAFNLANVSQSLDFDEQLVAHWLPRLPKLKRAILAVSYPSLFFKLNDGDERWRQYYYWRTWHIPPPREEDRFDIRMWSDVVLYGPRVCLSALRHGFRVNLAEGVDANGWFPSEPALWSTTLSAAAAAGRLKNHHRMMHEAHLAANAASLENILTAFRDRGVEVVLVAIPVWSTYADQIRPELWDRTTATVKALAERYGVQYLDFLRAPGFTQEDFHDVDHLSKRGAGKFTPMLVTAMKADRAPLARSTEP